MEQDHALRMAMPVGVRPTSRAFASVEVHADADAIGEDWAALERETPCSIYQTRAWVKPWAETLGRRAGLVPLYALARDPDGRAVALICLGVSQGGPIRVATWIGGKDANFGMPLARPGIPWSRREVARLLRETARAAGRTGPDVFVLGNQPFAWNGAPNPFALLPHQQSPSAAYATALAADAEVLFAAKLSKDARKKLRKKEHRLAALGPVTHRIAATEADTATILDALLAMRLARFRKQGIRSAFETPAMRAFLDRAAAPFGAGIELHALSVGERIVAVYGGAAHGGQWSGMVNAFESEEKIARSSPGELLLMRVIADACAKGIRRLDLGIGEARYKASICDETVALFDTFVAVTIRGAIGARVVAAQQTLKRIVKADERLFRWVKRARRLRA